MAMMSRRACSAMAWWSQVAASGITPGSVPQVGRFHDVVGLQPERFVGAQALDQRENDLPDRLAQRGLGAGGRRGRPPDLTDAEPRGQRFGAEPEIGGEPRGVAGPDVLLETVRGETS